MERNQSIVALAVADLHLSALPSIARSAEPDWQAAMDRMLSQLRAEVEKYPVPLLVAGDIFHRWNEPASVINYAIRALPRCYAVPGNHDLPFHDYGQIKKSAYWTLVEAGIVTYLPPGEPVGVEGLQLWGWPHGFPVKACPKPHSLALDVAVVHDFIWIKGKGYEHAPLGQRLHRFRERLRGYNAAVFGDNHRGFVAKSGDTAILNAGCFLRRRADEAGLAPALGRLHADGSWSVLRLVVPGDKFIEQTDRPEPATIDMGDLLAELRAGKDRPLDFEEAVKREMRRGKLSRRTRRVILEAMERR